MRGVQVSLSSGDVFFVADSDLEAVADHFRKRGLSRVGDRYVNGSEVAQLLLVPEIPSVEKPECLEVEHGTVS